MKKISKNLLEEKKFYERLIKINPNFIEVLFQLSHIYVKLKNYKKALKIDKKIADIMPFDPISYYNLACDYSLLGDIKNSFKNLRIALILGFKDKNYIKKDPDLRNLRNDRIFREIEKIIGK
jgi:tetratricopeptide (TPR) repeat protein